MPKSTDLSQPALVPNPIVNPSEVRASLLLLPCDQLSLSSIPTQLRKLIRLELQFSSSYRTPKVQLMIR